MAIRDAGTSLIIFAAKQYLTPDSLEILLVFLSLFKNLIVLSCISRMHACPILEGLIRLHDIFLAGRGGGMELGLQWLQGHSSRFSAIRGSSIEGCLSYCT
jgi:hypothetical protein